MLLSSALAQTTGGLPRFPDVGQGHVVFTAGGDLWKVPVEGGTARRLTTHPGDERFARISPDGQWIAYTAEYQGDADVWVIPFDGGAPRRLTWHSLGFMDDVVWDWTPDSKRVVFGSRFEAVDNRYASLYTVSLEGDMPVVLPTSDAGPTKLIGDDGSYVFNRKFRNFRTWKRYRGGMQQDLWRWDATQKTSEQLTTWPGTDTHPMVAGDAIFFVSDRSADGEGFATRNLFRLGEGGEATALTAHADFDVSWPSIDGDTIVYGHGGDLRVYDVASKSDTVLNIDIPDEALATLPRVETVHSEVGAQTVGPQGKRVAGIAHGRLFSVPAEHGDWRQVAGESGSRIVDAAWSPDGKKIAVISDRSGEHELWLVNQDGSGLPRRLTQDNDTWLTGMRWSPDGKRILFTDKRMRLWDVVVESGEKTLVDQGERWAIHNASYSHDGGWIAYIRPDENWHGAVWIYNVFTGENTRVTDDFNDDFDVAWDPEGHFLYLASRRAFDLVSNVYEFRLVHRRTDLLYAVRLKGDGPDPVPARSDEEVDDEGSPVFDLDEAEEEDKKKEKRRKRRNKKKVVLEAPELEIELDGLGDRLVRLPIEPGRYDSLEAIEGAVLFTAWDPIDDGEADLFHYDLEEQEAERVTSDVVAYEVAASGEKLLAIDSDGDSWVVDASPDADAKRVSFWGISTRIDPKEEWTHSIDEVRRYMRDHFYDPGMHGHDWDALAERYAGLLSKATTESDVRWLLGELIAELNVGHAYIWGEWNGVRSVSTGYLGADLVQEGEGVRITRVLRGEPGDPSRTPPLARPGADVRDGSWLVMIDGHELEPGDNPYRWLVGTAGRRIRIAVNEANPDMAGAREIEVEPVHSEAELRYHDWVVDRRDRVSKASNGRVGYIHVPNTSSKGYTEFVRGLYAQHRKDALVIDVRYNRGGFIPEMFVEHLIRPHYNTWVPRDGMDWRTPTVAMHGPMAMIANGYAGSGGDAFPYYFKQFELGPVVGETTWGGLVGIDNSLQLLIGGGITAPSFGFVNREGEWDVEREGVEPTVPLVEPPEAPRKGEDPQLDKAVELVIEALEGWESPVPGRPREFPKRP